MNGCKIVSNEPKPLKMNELLDGQLAQIVANGDIVQCFDATKYGANKKHYVVLGSNSGRSYSTEKGAIGPDMPVKLLAPGATIVVQ